MLLATIKSQEHALHIQVAICSISCIGHLQERNDTRRKKEEIRLMNKTASFFHNMLMASICFSHRNQVQRFDNLQSSSQNKHDSLDHARGWQEEKSWPQFFPSFVEGRYSFSEQHKFASEFRQDYIFSVSAYFSTQRQVNYFLPIFSPFCPT